MQYISIIHYIAALFAPEVALEMPDLVYHTMCFCGLNLRLLACVNVNSQCAPHVHCAVCTHTHTGDSDGCPECTQKTVDCLSHGPPPGLLRHQHTLGCLYMEVMALHSAAGVRGHTRLYK